MINTVTTSSTIRIRKCKILDCRRPVSNIPSGSYFALCDVHKLKKRNNGSDFRGTIDSHVAAPFRYFSHRLIAKVIEQTGDLRNTSSTPSVEEVTWSWPNPLDLCQMLNYDFFMESRIDALVLDKMAFVDNKKYKLLFKGYLLVYTLSIFRSLLKLGKGG